MGVSTEAAPRAAAEAGREGGLTPPAPRGGPQRLGQRNGEMLLQWLQWCWDTGAGGMQLMAYESRLLGPTVPCAGEKVFGRDY